MHFLQLFPPFALGYFVSYLLRSVSAVIAPDLVSGLGLDAAALGLLSSLYFLSFGVAQIPVGIALDRYGPRRVEATLLVLAALGCAAFALGEGATSLGLARALIGLGVSACLMASLKAFHLWCPPERQSSMTGFIMAAGALGALSASKPLAALLPWLGWRGVFWGLAGISLLAAGWIWRSLPDARGVAAPGGLRATLGALGEIYRNPRFLVFTGVAALFTGGFMAVQGLWALPWLMEVDGLSRDDGAWVLLLLGVGMLSGQLGMGFLGTAMARRGIGPERMMRSGLLATWLTEGLIVSGLGPLALPWFLLGLLSAANSQVYLATAQHFPRELFGRVSTAINLVAFAGAFAVQWGIGVLVELGRQAGLAPASALRLAFATLLVLQALALLPLLRSRRRR